MSFTVPSKVPYNVIRFAIHNVIHNVIQIAIHSIIQIVTHSAIHNVIHNVTTRQNQNRRSSGEELKD